MKDIVEESTEINEYQRPLSIVNRDFKRAKNYLSTWHNDCIERYQHYKAPGLAKNILSQDKLPVPFTTEQVDQFVADAMEKLWFKNEPCGIYGRNDTDKEDADAKREFMKYQDKEDNLYDKTKEALLHCAIYGISPAVVNYKEEFELQQTVEVQPVTMEDGTLVTDVNGEPQYVEVPTMVQLPVYQGSTVELVDPIDLYWTKEKRKTYDEHPWMIRNRVSLEWLKKATYIIQDQIRRVEMSDEEPGSDMEDLLDDKRSIIGYDMPDETDKEYEYIEWYGYENFDGEWALWILGRLNGKYIVRMDKAKDTFHLGHPNIVVGNIDKEFGEVRGQSLLDKIHSMQHTMDSLMGMWVANLKQTVNKMWVVNKQRVKTKRLVNEPGHIINTDDDVNKVAKQVETSPISQDIYSGLEMTRIMGQNASGIKDITSGVVQEGVETLGEASILQSQGALRIKHYLKTFESTFIQPLWEMRNQINQIFVKDAGYLYSVIEEKVMYWRTIEPGQVRSAVDFICEASNRENQKAVLNQQILQALNILTGLAPTIGPIPAVMLVQKLYRDAFNWSEDDIKELLPMDMIIQNLMMMMGGGMAQSPSSMSQPKSEGDAIQGAMQKNTTQVGQVG